MEAFTLRPDQIEDLGWFMVNKKGLFLSDPGTGKTPVVCVLQRWLWDTHGVATVWVMPNSLRQKNLEEAMRFGGWSEGDVIIVDENEVRPGARVYIMGFTRFVKVWKDLPDTVKALHIDESHKAFGGHESQRTIAMWDFMKKRGEWFVPMTGTLINGKLDTAFPVIQVIEPRYYGSYAGFKQCHHVVDTFTLKTTGYRDHQILGEIFIRHGRRRRFTDIHGPEAKVMQTEWIDLLPEQAVVYHKFHEEGVLELERFFIEGKNPGVAFTRARQIMEHPNCFPDLTDPKAPPINILSPGQRAGKIERLEFHITDAIENDTPLVIFSSMRPQQHEILALVASLGGRAKLMNGENPEERAGIDADFRAGRIKILVCSPEVADTGFNWQFCGHQEVGHVVFVTLHYVDTVLLQAYRRFMRQKRSTALRITTMLYRKTIDEHISRIVAKKSREAKKVDPDRVEFSF